MQIGLSAGSQTAVNGENNCHQVAMSLPLGELAQEVSSPSPPNFLFFCFFSFRQPAGAGRRRMGGLENKEATLSPPNHPVTVDVCITQA